MIAQQSETQFKSDLEAASVNRSWAILADLQKAHLRLLSAVQNLAKATGRSSPDKLEYSAARFRVGEASLARRIVFRAACDFLLQAASPSDQQAVSRLRSADADLARFASHHVSQWTTEKVDLDWEGYCTASKEMRRLLLKQIELERSTLYPLLHKYGSSRRREIRLIPIDEFIAEEMAAG